ncbi:unnamed protein product, partial [marine sediment metagenome]
GNFHDAWDDVWHSINYQRGRGYDESAASDVWYGGDIHA